MYAKNRSKIQYHTYYFYYIYLAIWSIFVVINSKYATYKSYKLSTYTFTCDYYFVLDNNITYSIHDISFTFLQPELHQFCDINFVFLEKLM